MPKRLYIVVLHYPALGRKESMTAIYGTAQAVLDMVEHKKPESYELYSGTNPRVYSNGNIYSDTSAYDYVSLDQVRKLAIIEKDPAAHYSDEDDVFKMNNNVQA
jgi:hypothetical protein